MSKINLNTTDWDLLEEDVNNKNYKYNKPRPSKRPKMKYKDYSENYEYYKKYYKRP